MADIKNVKEINNLGFNKEKTEELIQNLQRDGVIVSVEDLSNYIRKQGLIVKVHIGRKRNYIQIAPQIFGIDLSTHGADLNEFFKEHMEMGRIKFIPDSDERCLNNIESSIRMMRKRHAVGYDDSFMTMDSYDEFISSFDENKKRYLELRDSICDRWELIMDDFKRRLDICLDELKSIDRNAIYSNVLSKLPSKEDYVNSFYMSISASAFPVKENLEMFSDDIKKQITEGLTHETIQTLYEIIGNTLNDAYENVNKVILTVQKNEKIAPKTLGGIKKAEERIGNKNIFHNNKISKIEKDIHEMLKLSSDIDAMIERAEMILAEIYGYGQELGIEREINLKDSALSEAELVEIYELMVDAETKKAEPSEGLFEKELA